MTSIDFAKRPGIQGIKRKASSMMDRRFVPRVKEFVQVLQHQPTTEEVIDYLQESFPEYARKKRVALRQSVVKALNTTDVLLNSKSIDATSELEDNYLSKRRKRASMEQKEAEEIGTDSDVSINDEELVDYKDTNIINNSMQNLYKTAALNKEKTTPNKPPAPAPVIDLTENTIIETNPKPLSLFQLPSKSPRSVQNKQQILHSVGDTSTQRQGLQVFAKNNQNKDFPTKSKINIHSSFLQDEVENGVDINETSGVDDSTCTEPVVLKDEKSNTLSSQLKSGGVGLNAINKALIAIPEDEKNSSSRPSTPNVKAKVHRPKSDFAKESKKRFEPTISTKSFQDIGGYHSCIQEVSKLLLHLKHPEVFSQLGIKPPRGFLLHGPPGCGKTLLANAIAGELGIPFYKIAATEIVSGISGDSEQRIRSLFAEAVAAAPSIIFIDEIDSITPKRENAGKEMERRVVTQILTCMDELSESPSHVLIVGATNRPDSLDPALRRAGRFDREIAMGIPDRAARKTILGVICKNLRLSPDVDFDKIAVKTPGFVGADIEALTREAAMCAVDSAFVSLQEHPIKDSDTTTIQAAIGKPSENSSSSETNSTVWLRDQPPLSEEQLSTLFISTHHFESALSHVQPSAKREGFATVPDVTWDNIGALEDIREELTLAIMAPVQNPEEFEALGLVTPPGILLCGPPGCGKTLLAKAIANEAGINFISVKGPELMNMYVGESEKAVRQVFQRARCSSPCVIFFDEIDALCPKRSHGDSNVSSRVVNQLLTEMDGLESRKNVFIMGATNRPDILDGAILRPGRMDKQLYVGLPNAVDREKILRALTKNGTKPSLSSDISLEQLASDERCDGFSGADMGALVREASVAALKDYMNRKRNQKKIETADESVQVSPDVLNVVNDLFTAVVSNCSSDSGADVSSTSQVEDTATKTENQSKDSSSTMKDAIVVNRDHFTLAFRKVNPSVSEKDRIWYEKMKTKNCDN